MAMAFVPGGISITLDLTWVLPGVLRKSQMLKVAQNPPIKMKIERLANAMRATLLTPPIWFIGTSLSVSAI
jgi:hypothetical protein